jgi:threonine dehydrogenase-like Zn-dependent dehydrogenase
MKTAGTFLVNDAGAPLRFGDVDLTNPPRREKRGLPEKEGILCRAVIAGFCGTDWELMQMGARGQLGPKFPAGQSRLINGHEGVVWVPDQQRYAVVLIRGGDSYDPSRFESDETYFEYGCDQADGLMAHEGYYHPDMLLEIPAEHLPRGAVLTRQLGMRLSFSDPMACMIFQRERIEDLLVGHNWRLFAARRRAKAAAMDEAIRDGFARLAIYGLGSTGLLGAIAIKDKYPDARIVALARSAPGGEKDAFLTRHWPDIQYLQVSDDPRDTVKRTIAALGGRPRVFLGTSGNAVEAEVAFGRGLLDNNGIYASFSLGPVISYDSMPFGFRNHLIFGAINFRRDHMEEAIRLLCRTPLDTLCREHPLSSLSDDPMGFYQEIYRGRDRAFKSVCVWGAETIA